MLWSPEKTDLKNKHQHNCDYSCLLLTSLIYMVRECTDWDVCGKSACW